MLRLCVCVCHYDIIMKVLLLDYKSQLFQSSSWCSASLTFQRGDLFDCSWTSHWSQSYHDVHQYSDGRERKRRRVGGINYEGRVGILTKDEKKLGRIHEVRPEIQIWGVTRRWLLFLHSFKLMHTGYTCKLGKTVISVMVHVGTWDMMKQ